MYIVDTSSFDELGHFPQKNFSGLWKIIDQLVNIGDFRSVREVRRELEINSKYIHIENWVKENRSIFYKPTMSEMSFINNMFKIPKNRELVKMNSILKGKPCADPFVIAAGKINNAIVISEESYKPGGAKIPTICKNYNIRCIKLEEFFDLEKVDL